MDVTSVFMGLIPSLIISAINPKKKGSLGEKEVELIFPRAKTVKGKFLNLLSDNKYSFETSDHQQIIIDADQLYDVIPS